MRPLGPGSSEQPYRSEEAKHLVVDSLTRYSCGHASFRMLCHAAIAASVLTCSATAQTTPPQPTAGSSRHTKTGPHPLNLDDLDHLLSVGSPQVSPDGKWVLYTVSRIDTTADKRITDLWMVSWDGTQDIRLTYGVDSSVSNPRWSPDGKYISFMAERPGAPKVKGSQVWVLDRRGGEARQLTEVKGNLSAYEWSPGLEEAAAQHCRRPRSRSQRERQRRQRQGETEAHRYRPLSLQERHRGLYLDQQPPRPALSLRHREQEARQADHRQDLPGRRRRLVARWHAGRLHQQPRPRPRPHHQHRCLRRRRRAQLRRAQAHDLPRP